MSDVTTQRKNVKAALEAAHAEIGKAIASVDHASGEKLAELTVGARMISSFVDFHNGGCASPLGLNSSELLKKLHG